VKFPIIVPQGYTATITIYLSSSDYLDAYVVALNNSNTLSAVLSISSPHSIYQWEGAMIDQTITLGTGHYLIEIINSIINSQGAYVTIEITTTLTPGN
jgi:hypothetical protein